MPNKVLDTRVVAIGKQDFEDMISHNNFYIDKTGFLKEWWENDDLVTLITRPRRFGKTLLMSTIRQFFSIDYKEKSWLFEGLKIFKEEKYRNLQGTYPVIFLSFAAIKETSFQDFYQRIQYLIACLFQKYLFLADSVQLQSWEQEMFFEVCKRKAERTDIINSLQNLSDYLFRYYERKPLILLDEYDTPMQEAYFYGYWEEMVSFIRNFFNASFKTNPYFERAILTGITRVSKESIFSDLNNLKVVTVTTEQYMDSFGFTEEEVFQALDDRGLGEQKEKVKIWYDGFTFGTQRDIYNPWSIINFLDEKRFFSYWANTSSNELISRQLQIAGKEIKEQLENLIQGKTITIEMDEQIIFEQLEEDQYAIWGLMLASGYLKTEQVDLIEQRYTLSLTNYEVLLMIKKMIKKWFRRVEHYNEFLKSLLSCDLEAMNAYMNRISFHIFSFFDVGAGNGRESEPERFYHGFVLGLIAELDDKYNIRSNRESGFGRYDVIMEPKRKTELAYIFEFKVYNPSREKELDDTANAGLKQIEEKKYEEDLIARGIPKVQIKKYAFAFKGKNVLIKENSK